MTLPSSPLPPLPPERLRSACDPAVFDFDTTAEVGASATDLVLGQERAVAAIDFAVGMRLDGFNLFVLGPPGVGKHSVLERLLAAAPAPASPPDDWCYVNNFGDAQRPRALRLPRGRGALLRDDMNRLLEELQSTIPAAFDSDEYRARVEQVDHEYNELQQRAFEEVARAAGAQGIALLRTPAGFSFAPMREREVMGPEEFEKLPQDERERIGEAITRLQQDLEKVILRVAGWRRERFEKLKKLNEEVTMFAVGSRVDELARRHADLPEVVAYLDAVRKDVVQNAEIFHKQRPEQPFEGMAAGMSADLPPTRRYLVNLLVDEHDAAAPAPAPAAPVLREDNPTYANLVGRVEHMARFGALVTDFNLIRPGALHRANGGYLLLDVARVLGQPFAWEALKRALTTREIRIESLGQQYGLVSTVSLEPQPIPLSVKVVLFGDRQLYYLLHAYDPDFARLFKVAADFADDIGRDPARERRYGAMIAALARERGLMPFDRTGVAAVIDDAARTAGDAGKLSLDMRRVGDLVGEAEFWARRGNRTQVGAAEVAQAVAARVARADRIRERMAEQIARGVVLIDTAGATVGQVNGLAVYALGEFAFAQPTRITATTRLGDGQVIDIERESALGGAIHAKGVLILSGYLASRYSARRALSLSASLVFEQTYGTVEGDSASLAELCALLSSLADLPIRQSLAVTGSVNQKGKVQAIGAVNEKIEGFFDICAARGLDGSHGVLIPAANAAHLMLREDIVAAARAGRFAVWAVAHVDEAIEILTGTPAGRDDGGGAPDRGTVNQRVLAKLAEYHSLRHAPAGGRRAGAVRKRRNDERRR
ncbi:MAG: AAA family ATPase [Burkholderiales bacterium]|nr:AAA family ATPase [Burkholderiales bacterium]